VCVLDRISSNITKSHNLTITVNYFFPDFIQILTKHFFLSRKPIHSDWMEYTSDSDTIAIPRTTGTFILSVVVVEHLE
jgi:hypothetical protein